MSERWKPSVTVAAIIERVIDAEARFLLVEEDTAEGLKLNNPAGHLEIGESPEQGVVREALEETTCHFTPSCLVGVYMARYQRPAAGEDVTYLRFAYAGTVSDPDPTRTLDTGIVRTLWMSIEELRACRDRHRSELVLACIEDYLAGKRYPLGIVHAADTVHTPEIKA
ncbi:MAG TPA: NUDIX hydrolase [Rhizobacter sp.]|nr:NUDIX hydrolase [Rhizobacter sp.]